MVTFIENIEQAFKEIFPDQNFNYDVKINYSGKFSPYNANVKLSGFYNLEFNLSKTWKGVDKEIVKGLVQDLLIKLFGTKKAFLRETVNLKLYNSFIRNLHIGIKKDKIEPVLKRSFERVNDKFFDGQVELTNLVWSSHHVSHASKRRLASYNFHTDTITVSKIFVGAEVELLDYVMYHEMLHKVMKFEIKNNKHKFHTKSFRNAEKAYPGSDSLEKRLKYLSLNKKRSILGWFK